MAKFEITVRKNGEFQFNLKASNGEVILTSEGYTTKSACLNGVESVKKNAHPEGDERPDYRPEPDVCFRAQPQQRHRFRDEERARRRDRGTVTNRRPGNTDESASPRPRGEVFLRCQKKNL